MGNKFWYIIITSLTIEHIIVKPKHSNIPKVVLS
jgi:hypothetical protein